jgi:hypothetical protein
MTLARSSALICILLLFPSAAIAWIRVHCDDATLVERSELIIVAHLKAGTITFVPNGQSGSMGVHHAVLVITKVLKGKCNDKELPLAIHYGLTPVVGGYRHQNGSVIDRRGRYKNYPKDIIEIFDTGGGVGGPSLVKDAREDALWFLRKRSGTFGREPGKGEYGIVDPEDVQPLEWKPYFLCYLSDHPAEAVRKCAAENPKAEVRAKNYLDHLQVQAILKIKNPKERFDKLLPFFLSRTTWNMKAEAEKGIISCGKVGGEGLRRLFNDPQYGRFRETILWMWREMEYKEVVPLVIELLKKHDQFWATQHLQQGWWNKDWDSEQTRHRHAAYGEVYGGICLLHSFRNPRAREVLELTRNRWESFHLGNRQIIDECEAALRALPQTEEKRSLEPSSRNPFP